jgi:hypothetical protein
VKLAARAVRQRNAHDSPSSTDVGALSSTIHRAWRLLQMQREPGSCHFVVTSASRLTLSGRDSLDTRLRRARRITRAKSWARAAKRACEVVGERRPRAA